MPNAPSDPAVMARVLVETAHRVLDQAHPARVTTVRVVPTATAHRETARHVPTEIVHNATGANVAPSATAPTAKAESVVRTGIVRRVTVRIAATAPRGIVPHVMVNAVSGSPVRVAIASPMVTASPMMIDLNVMVSVVPTETDLNAMVNAVPTTIELLVMVGETENAANGSLVKAATASLTATARSVRDPLVEIVPVTRPVMAAVTVNVVHTAIARSVMTEVLVTENVVSGSPARETSAATSSPVTLATESHLVTALMVIAHVVTTGNAAVMVTVPSVMASVVSGSPVRVGSVVATVIVLSVMVAVMVNVVRMVIALSAVIALSTVTVRARMTAVSVMSAPN